MKGRDNAENSRSMNYKLDGNCNFYNGEFLVALLISTLISKACQESGPRCDSHWLDCLFLSIASRVISRSKRSWNSAPMEEEEIRLPRSNEKRQQGEVDWTSSNENRQEVFANA